MKLKTNGCYVKLFKINLYLEKNSLHERLIHVFNDYIIKTKIKET